MKKLQPRCLAFLLLLLVPCSLSAQTRVDTLYSVAALDGSIAYFERFGTLDARTDAFGFGVGDAIAIDNGPFYERGYISFDLSTLPADANVDNAQIIVRQHFSMGDGHFGWYPKWGVPGGDTMFCIVDHVNYGSELDTTDWTAGDIGNAKTVATNIGTLSRDSLIGFKALDVTAAVRNDRQSGRSRSQFRVRFPVLTDYDGLNDYLTFDTGEYPPSVTPRLVVRSSTTSTREEDKFPIDFTLYQNYPNPFNPTTQISYGVPEQSRITLTIYNALGQEVRRLADGIHVAGNHTVIWNATNSTGEKAASGVYLYKLEAVGSKGATFVQTKKLVLLK